MSNLVVQTNILALNSHRNLKVIGDKQTKASQKLSSGYKINSAADDAAGLAISEKMRSQIRGLDMASKNAQDAISLIQTAEGGMQEIDNMVQRIRELVVYAANDTQDADNGGVDVEDRSGIQLGDRQKIQDEINTLMKEIDSMAGRVEFNKKKLIDGTYASDGAAGGGTSAAEREWQKLNDASLAATIDNVFAKAASDAAVGLSSDASDAATSAVSDAVDVTSATLDTLITALNTAVTNNDITTDEGDILSASMTTINELIKDAVSDLNSATTQFEIDNAKKTITDTLSRLKEQVQDDSTLESKAETGILAYIQAIEDSLNSTADKSIGAAFDDKEKAIEAEKAMSAAATASDIASDAVIDTSNALSDFEDEQGGPPPYPDTEAAVTNTGNSIYFQVGANATQGWSLNIGNITCKGLGLAADAIEETGVVEAAEGNIDPDNYINVLKMTGEGELSQLLDTIDNALTIVTTERSKLGAAQNRLEYTKSSLDISSENLSASESRIRDTDMAKEMMKMTAANVLQQAGVSMLAQANQAPQSVLQLLG